MHNSRETRIINFICAGIMLSVGIIHLFGGYIGSYLDNIVICVLFAAMLFLWTGQMRKRLLQTEEKRYFTYMTLLLVLLMIIRTAKFIFTPDGHFSERYLWYLYYLPIVFAVLFMFFGALHVGRPYNYRINRSWKLLYIPAAAIAAVILTNDIHQWAFRFYKGIEQWETYSHNWAYFAAVLWIAGLLVATMAITFSRSLVSGSRKKIWMPAIPLAGAFVYFAACLISPDGLLSRMFKFAEMICFVLPAFAESLILSRLIPSNDNYSALLHEASIAGGIMDFKGNICYSTKKNIPVLQEQVMEALNHPVSLEGGNMLLGSIRVQGGFGYWTKDISEINRLNRMLEDMGDVLTEENSMLDAENRLTENRIMLEEQNRLYDSIARDVASQLESLDSILNSPAEEEAEFEQQMKYASLLISYIKRRSNLLLLYNQQETIHSDELKLAVSETIEYIKLCGIKAYSSFSGEQQLPRAALLPAYEIFEKIIEASIPGADAVLVNAEFDGGITMNIELDRPGNLLQSSNIQSEAEQLGGSFEVETDGDTEFITIFIPAGGEPV